MKIKKPPALIMPRRALLPLARAVNNRGVRAGQESRVGGREPSPITSKNIPQFKNKNVIRHLNAGSQLPCYTSRART